MGVQEWKNYKICILLIAWSEIDCSLMSDSLQLTASANQQKIQWAYTWDSNICCGAHFGVMSSKPDGICINDDDVRLNVLGCRVFVSKYACTLHVRFNLWNSKLCYWRAINQGSRRDQKIKRSYRREVELDPHFCPEEVELGWASWTSFASSCPSCSSTAVQRTLS